MDIDWVNTACESENVAFSDQGAHRVKGSYLHAENLAVSPL